MPRRPSEQIDDPLRIGGKAVLQFDDERPAAESVSPLTQIDVEWERIFELLEIVGDERQFLETKSVGMTQSNAARTLGWSAAKSENVSRRTERKIARSTLTGRRKEFTRARHGSRCSLNPVRRIGQSTWEPVHLDEQNFGSVMRAELLQPVEIKQSVLKMSLDRETKMQFKPLKFELKQIEAETGTFTGILSMYGAVDLTRDVVMPGAFTKTLREHGGIVPLLLNHASDRQVGILRLSDSKAALLAEGRLNLDLPSARDASSMLKFNLENGVKPGLSIGYQSIRDEVKNGTRFLQEIRLYEGSLTPFPACEEAVVTSAKALNHSKLTATIAELRGLLAQASR